MELREIHVRMLEWLQQRPDGAQLTELSDGLRVDQSQIHAACVELSQAGHVELSERAVQEFSLGPEGERHANLALPERVIAGVLEKCGGSCKVTDVPTHCDLDAGQVGQSLRWLSQRGWATKSGDLLTLAADAAERLAKREPDERMIAALAGGKKARTDELSAAGVDVAAAQKLLSPRKGFLTVKDRSERSVRLRPSGAALLKQGVKGRRRVTQLTPELMTDGAWREADLQPYDVTLAAQRVFPGKEHAFQRTLDKVRRVFLELGFSEIVSPWVESSFWDFDALFQPQDHPARDMQDTFYVARPDRTKLPDDRLVERVRETHENGGGTGSSGWQYAWNRELAHKPVLRTHTTAATIRALSAHKSGTPGKYFVIGPVFRRETVDYKHLPMFHQVDGIIVDAKGSLASLLGTLGAFYGKMGFPKVRFRPSFFPYTEPSAEAYLWFESRQEWVEMGGCGIFRPEVTQPLGVRDRVLAWGLGLERLAMMIHGLKTIGEIYFSSMPWLREAPSCRS